MQHKHKIDYTRDGDYSDITDCRHGAWGLGSYTLPAQPKDQPKGGGSQSRQCGVFGAEGDGGLPATAAQREGGAVC